MVQQPGHPQVPPGDFHPQIVLSPTPYAPQGPAELPARSVDRLPAGQKVRARTHAIREVVVVEVAGRLGDVVEELDRAIQLALADGPRGVVCDLTAVLEGADPVAVEVLATSGRHVLDWPGIPVAVACPDPRVREALAAQPLGGHLIVTASLFSAVTAVLATPTLAVQWLRLAPHPTAPRAAREFVTRTLLDWRLGRVIPFASRVVSELVASSSVHVGTDIDLSVVWNLGSLRLTVRDHGPGLPDQRASVFDLHGRGLSVVTGLSRSFGALPTADGGKVVWAVLEAPRPRPSDRRIRPGRASASQDSPVFTDGRGLAELPFCAGVSSHPTRESVPVRPGGDHTLAR
jgi:hypothetical protein